MEDNAVPKDYYDSGADSGSDTDKSDRHASDNEESTALLPKDFFPKPPEVGKTCKIKVVAILEEEVEVEYVKHDDEKKDDNGDDETEREMKSLESSEA